MSVDNIRHTESMAPPEHLSPVLMAAVAQSFNAIVVTDTKPWPEGPAIVYVNAAFCRMSGYSSAEMIGKTPRILQGEQTSPEVIAELRDCLSSGRFFQGSTVNYRKDGSPYAVEWNISPVSDEAGVVTHYVSVQRDITDFVAVQSSRQLLSQALDVAQDAIFITDVDGVIEFANQGFEVMTGYGASEVLGSRPGFLKSGEQTEAFYRELWRTLKAGETFNATVVNRHKKGHLIHCEESITSIRNGTGEVTHFVSIIKDLTSRVMQERELRRLAEYDALTGLLNRRSGEQKLGQAYLESRESRRAFCVLMLDIDHFKHVNDTWGHAVGDEILKLVARALRASVRATDSVVRWGGEEFLIVLPVSEEASALGQAERVRSRIESTRMPEAGTVTVSIGVAQIEAGESLADCLQRADGNLYQAKHDGRNRVYATIKAEK